MRRLNVGLRSAGRIENNLLKVTVTEEGGHVAEILDKRTGVNPLWTPPWPSIEPSAYDAGKHAEYGGHSEAKLLAGILGHNICLDLFGEPGLEEARAGIPVHGEAPVAKYELSDSANGIEMRTTLPKAQLRFTRKVSVSEDSIVVRFNEELENLSATDKPIAWTQHVTLGPPFLECGRTQFRASATRSKVVDSFFNDGKGHQEWNAEFDWPFCPLQNGRTDDLRVFSAEPASAGFTAHLMDPDREHAWFAAWSPTTQVLFGYVWRRADFPWLARWEENHFRRQPPWNGNGLTCGMEFGVSPFVESRRAMVTRGRLFGVPTFRWALAQTTMKVEYCAFITTRQSIAERVIWDGGEEVRFE